MDAHDIAPMRVCRRRALLDLGVRDRAFGYPVELMQQGRGGGLAVRRARRRLPPPRRGNPLQGVRVAHRERPRRPRLRPGPAMTARVLLVAKSPVPGRVKTRLGADVGMDLAADLAATAFLDTVRTCADAVGVDRCRLALEGDLAESPYADRLARAARGMDGLRAARRRPGRAAGELAPRPGSGGGRPGRPDRHGHPASDHRGPGSSSSTGWPPTRRCWRTRRTAAGGHSH